MRSVGGQDCLIRADNKLLFHLNTSKYYRYLQSLLDALDEERGRTGVLSKEAAAATQVLSRDVCSSREHMT